MGWSDIQLLAAINPQIHQQRAPGDSMDTLVSLELVRTWIFQLDSLPCLSGGSLPPKTLATLSLPDLKDALSASQHGDPGGGQVQGSTRLASGGVIRSKDYGTQESCLLADIIYYTARMRSRTAV